MHRHPIDMVHLGPSNQLVGAIGALSAFYLGDPMLSKLGYPASSLRPTKVAMATASSQLVGVIGALSAFYLGDPMLSQLGNQEGNPKRILCELGTSGACSMPTSPSAPHAEQ